MIVRILRDGQYDLSDERIGELAELRDDLVTAVLEGDESGYGPALATVVAAVHHFGTPRTCATLTESDVVLPALDADLAEVRTQLAEEGLIQV